MRVPTWAPFRLQVYFNAHHWLAQRLNKAGIDFKMADNAFLFIAGYRQAQAIANRLDAKQLHRRLNEWANQFCPVHQRFRSGYHWSLMQVEFATDVIFHRQADFQPLYESIVRTAVQAVKADNVATFLGRKLTTAYRGELGNDFSTRIQGTRIRHQMGPSSIKLYDKVFVTIGRGEWSISGFRATDLRAHIPNLSPGQSSYLLKRPRTHGRTKKIGHRYKYYLTKFGRRVLAAALKIRQYLVLPTLCTDNA